MAGSDAFISYSHHADGDLAPALEAGLQGLAKPWNQRRAMEVFLDQQDLSASPHLWSSIVVALDQSEWFVLLASPGSAGSKWVGQEITHWLSVPERRERLLVVLTAGTMRWEDGDFTADSDAVNPALRGAFDEEPFFVDMTQLDRAIALDLRNPLFKERVATLAATIRGTTVGNLIGEDTRQYLRARRLRRIALISLAVLTVGAVVASIVALQQRSVAQEQQAEAELQRNEALRQQQEAEAQRAVAEQNAAEARSRELAATALDTMRDDPVLATLIAVEASYPGDAVEPIDVAEARTTLGITMRNVQGATVLKVGPRITTPTSDLLVADGEHLAGIDLAKGTRDADGAVIPPTWWDTQTGEVVDAPVPAETIERMMARFGDVEAAGSAISFTPVSLGVTPVTEPFDMTDDAAMVVGVDATTGDLVAESLVDGSVIARADVPDGDELYSVVVLSPDLAVAADEEGRALVWEIASGVLREMPLELDVDSISPVDDRRFVAGGYQIFTGFDGVPEVDFSTRSSVVVAVDESLPGVVEIGLDVSDVDVAGGFVPSPDAALLAAVDEGDGVSQPIIVWDTRAGERVATIDTAQVNDLRWVDATTLAVASTRGVEQFRLRLDVGVTSGQFAAASVAGDSLALREFLQSTVAVVDGSLAESGMSSGPVAAGAVDSPWPGSVSLAPDGAVVAGMEYEATTDGFFTTPTGVTVRSLPGRDVLAEFPGARGVAFDPTGEVLAVGAEDAVLLVDTDDWTVTRTIDVDGYTPEQLLWADGGRLLVVHGVDQVLGVDRRSDVLDVASGEVLVAGPVGVVGMALSDDGSLLALGMAGGEVRLVPGPTMAAGAADLEPAGVMVADSVEVRGLAFSPDGARLVTSGVRATTVWDVRVPSSPRQVQVVTDLAAWTFQGAFSSDVVGVPRTSKGAWGVVAFRPDGKSFVLAGGSGAVELPDFDPGRACREVDDADLARVERLLGEPSACLRVPGLRD